MLNLKSFQTIQPLTQTYPGSSAQTKGYVEQAINPHQRGVILNSEGGFWGSGVEALVNRGFRVRILLE